MVSSTACSLLCENLLLARHIGYALQGDKCRSSQSANVLKPCAKNSTFIGPSLRGRQHSAATISSLFYLYSPVSRRLRSPVVDSTSRLSSLAVVMFSYEARVTCVV